MSDMPEEFFNIEEFDNLYSISTHGRVYSKKSKRFLTLCKDKKGYLQVCIGHNGETFSRKAHRLIADNILNRENGLVVNHIDGDRSNNNIQNIECISQRENVSHGRVCNKYVGITFFKPAGRWQARITINGERKFLGYFDTKEQASDAYIKALDFYGLENKYARK